MNNKGQVLVAFLLLLPLFFLITAFLFDFGSLSIQKRRITNIVEEALIYASKNKGSDTLEEEVATFLDKNIEESMALQTIKEKDYFEIQMEIELKGMFKNILKGRYQYMVKMRKQYQEKGDLYGT